MEDRFDFKQSADRSPATTAEIVIDPGAVIKIQDVHVSDGGELFDILTAPGRNGGPLASDAANDSVMACYTAMIDDPFL